MNKLKALWLTLDSGLWFVPTLMVLAALFAAYGLVHLDIYVGTDWTARYPLLFGAGAAGARGMLSAIAGSMITVAGLIFSLTLATLAQVASQYTSRLLRNFMRDRANQVVMGFFVSIFVYCLVALRTIWGGDEGSFVPSLAVAFELLLALVSIGMLIFLSTTSPRLFRRSTSWPRWRPKPASCSTKCFLSAWALPPRPLSAPSWPLARPCNGSHCRPQPRATCRASITTSC